MGCQKVEAEDLAKTGVRILLSRPGEAKTLALKPDEATILDSKLNETVNHISFVLCIATEVSILSSKSRSGINNLCLHTRPTYRILSENCLVFGLE